MPQKLRIKQALLRTIAFGGAILSIALFFIVHGGLPLV